MSLTALHTPAEFTVYRQHHPYNPDKITVRRHFTPVGAATGQHAAARECRGDGNLLTFADADADGVVTAEHSAVAPPESKHGPPQGPEIPLLGGTYARTD